MAKHALLVENSSQQVSNVFPFGPELFEVSCLLSSLVSFCVLNIIYLCFFLFALFEILISSFHL